LEQRSQRRIHAAVPVELEGVDAHGETFKEATEAVEVSRRGLSVLTRRDLPVYTTLAVTLPGRGPVRPGEGPTDFYANATVVRSEKSGEENRVSIRFVGATLAVYTAETS
jgi:PilZ domain